MNRRIIIVIVAVIAIFAFMRVAGNSKKKKPVKKEPVEQSAIVFNQAVQMLSKDSEKAIEAFENIVEKYPDTAEAEKSLMETADFYKKNNEILLEKEHLQKLIDNYPDSEFRKEAVLRLGNINVELLFSKAQTKNSTEYEVKPGDSLYKIAKQFGTNVELIMRVNHLDNSLIKPGMKLKIITAVFSIDVDKAARTLTLKADGEVLKVYPVGIGADNSTPVGEFKITARIVNPVWYRTGAIVPAGSSDNILGARWLGLSEPGYGIHGTVDNKPIQEQKTQGCVRMMNKDVEELFDIVPVGTKVTIED